METNSQIKLDAGKFIGKCVFSKKIPALMTLCFAIVSVISCVLKLGESAGEKDMKILQTGAIIINVMMIFFIVHAFLHGRRRERTGFLEIPLLGFEVLSFSYYMLLGYIRLSRLDELEGFLPLVMGWSYAIYILLFAVSCALLLSFIKSGVILRSMSSMLAFIADLGMIASVVLALSYGLCLIFGEYSNDPYILFSFSDTLNLMVAPILLIGYWLLFRRAGGEIEETFDIIYRRLLKSATIIDLDEEDEQEKPQEPEQVKEAEEIKEEVADDKADEPTTPQEKEIIDFVSIPFESDKDDGSKDEATDTQSEKVSRFEEFVDIDGESDKQKEEPDAVQADELKETEKLAKAFETDKELSDFEKETVTDKASSGNAAKVVLKILTITVLSIIFIVLLVLNAIPAIIKGVLYAAYGITAAFGKARYSITYSLRMVFDDGHISAEKRNAMSSLKERTLADAEKIKALAKKIKLLSFKNIKDRFVKKDNPAKDFDENTEE